MSANIRIIFSETGHTWVVPVMPQTTLRQIINHIGMDPEQFNLSSHNPYVFVNEGHTIMSFVDSNMIDYNNWCIDKEGYISSLYVKRLKEVNPSRL